MSRPKQSRRPPHPSLGSINFTSPDPMPRSQGTHEYSHQSTQSNTSLPSLGSVTGVSAQERLVKSLVDKMIAKMPSYSGLSLSALETDESLIQVHEALLQLSRHCANIIVLSLSEILEKFQKKHVGSETNMDVLESEIYIVRVLILILNFRTNIYKEEHMQTTNEAQPFTPPALPSKISDPTLHSDASSTLVVHPHSRPASTLVEPPALDDNVAKYCLAVMLGFIRRSGPTKADALRASGKLDTLNNGHEFQLFQLDKAVLHVTRHLPFKLDANVASSKSQSISGSSALPYTNGSKTSVSSGNTVASDVAMHIPSAGAVYLSTFPNHAPSIITHLAGKVIFYLSASNWPIVFSKIRNRIHYFAGSMVNDGLDIVELRLLTYSSMDRGRLVQVLQELSSLLVNMKPDVQGAVAVTLRTVVWKWIEVFPEEFAETVQSSRRILDGQPERVFDVLYQLVDPTNKRLLWPTLAVLAAISPERLKAAEAALNGTLRYGKKHNNYLEHLRSVLTTQSRLGDVAVMCYNDMCRAAFYLPPLAENAVLRSLAPDLADELKSRLMNPPSPARPFYDSSEPIDVTLYAETLAVILYYRPVVALVGVLPECLALERSPAVKLCVVRALTTLVTEAPKSPWHPALDKSIYSYVAPKLRATALDLANPKSSSFTSRPLSLRDGSPNQTGDDRKDLILCIHALWRLDFGFFFTSIKDDEYKPFIDASLKVLQLPKDDSIQASTLRTIGAFLSKVNDPHDEYFDAVNVFMYHAGTSTLLASAQELVRVTDDFDENLRCMNMIVAVLSQLADRSMDGRQAWKYTEEREIALAVVELALILHLPSYRLDLCTLAAKGMRLLVATERDAEAPPPQQYTLEQATFRAPLFESLGDAAKITVLGRVDFQKKMRNTCSSRSFPCIIHLAAWREAYYRWSLLMPIITGTGSRSSTDILSPNGSLAHTQTFEEKQREWGNLSLALASAAGACLSDDPNLNAPHAYGLPFRKDITDEKPSVLVDKYIRELIELLTDSWVPARTTARDALGLELHPKFFELMFDHLNTVINDLCGEDAGFLGPQNDNTMIFVEQVISIFKLIIDRVGDAEGFLIKIDLGPNLRSLARFIHRSETNTSERRIKSRFCALIDNLLEKRDKLQIRQESVIRNSLLDIIADWVLEYSNGWSEDDITRNEQIRIQRESNLAALKTCVNLVENLHLQAHDGSTGSDTAHVVSRLFHRYFSVFVMTIAPRPKESETALENDQASQHSAFGGKNDALVQELVISGIASMLHANTDAGTKHVLTLGYKDSPRLRAVFAHVFCRVLSRGTKFGNYLEGFVQNSRKSKLCEMVKESEAIAQAIIDVCPISDIDTIVPVLLNIYDTRRGLLHLLKTIIRREVDTTNSDIELFRSNDICSRILSAFAKSHGYHYLRSITKPLITLMLELPSDRGFELDPTKLRPGETQEENAETLKMITKAFLRVISESVAAIPLIIREVCRYIKDSVTSVWPESRYAAVGAFIFLRFIVPGIVAPETIDIELPRNDRTLSIRRGLLLVGKIIQNLANNMMFGKEAHMMRLNSFLEANIGPVTRFHNDILKITPEPTLQNPDEWLGTSYDETDTIILHRFFQKNADKVGKVLLSLSRTTNSHETTSVSGKRIWDSVCSLLVEMGAAMEPPMLIDQPSSFHKTFRTFMLKNGHRNTDSVREIFQSTISLKYQHPFFVLGLSKINVETMDLDLLMYHIFKTIKEKKAFEQPFSVVVDCTSFTSMSEIPLSWCKLFVEHLPSDLRTNFETAYILNSNATAQRFLRKLYHVCSDASFPNEVLGVSSVAELVDLVQPAALTPVSYAATMKSTSFTSYQCHQYQRNQIQIPIVMQIGNSHVHITSVKTQSITPNLSAKTVEIIPLVDIGDVHIALSRGETPEFLIRRALNGGDVTFSSPERDDIIKAIRLAKSKLHSFTPLIPAERNPRLADVSAALLNVGLLNVCDEDESLRGAAYDLLSAVCSYVNYEANPLVPLRGPFIPSNTAAFIQPFSERLAKFVPQLTLDVISEFSLGFEKASMSQKITCLQYLTPWIKNMAMFAKPTDPHYDPTGERLRDSIRSLIDITVKFPDVYPVIQRSIWTEVGRHDSSLLNVALEELMRAAIDGGLGSARCEQIADTLIAMSSINIRAKVLTKLRRVVTKASLKSTRSLSQSPAWNEITTLTRLALVAGYSSRLAVQSLIFVPEIVHLTTMLCATGTSNMKRTVYGMAMNLVQSLHIARSDEEGAAKELKRILDDASDVDTLQKFGLVRAHPSSEYASIEYPPDQVPMAALEGITELLIKALTYGAQSTGLLNVWRGRWMSLVTATAFQICPYIQYRAFVVLGLLASSDNAEVDDDLLYQMLVAFRNALTSFVDSDPGPVTSMLRCIAKVVPGLGADSRYLPQVFWLAVALLQSTYLPLYGEAACLLEATLSAMARQGMFKDRPMSIVLLESRVPLVDTTTQLDSIMGLSFETGFSFSLASIIFRGIRPPAVRPIALRLLRTVLRIAAESSTEQMERDPCYSPIPLDHDILGYFLALLPFDSTSSTYRELLKEGRVDTRWWPSDDANGGEDDAGGEDDDDGLPTVDIDLFGFSPDDRSTPLLVISFIFSMLNSYQGSERQQEFLFSLLAQLGQAYEDLCASAVVHYLVNPRSEGLLSNLTDNFFVSPQIGASLQVLFRIAMTSSVWSAVISSSTTPASENDSHRTQHYKALEDLDMHALSVTWQFLPKGSAEKVLQWIPLLVEAIIE